MSPEAGAPSGLERHGSSATTNPPGGLRAIPERPGLEDLESRWTDHWESEGIYRFDRATPREEVFSIDTPPPTVSGSLHVGHVFSYTQTDVIARYWRMRGRNVFYPIGWDDNGLPTERRVQNHFGVRCDPQVGYVADFQPPDPNAKESVAISRPNFVELCERLTAEDERAFEELFRRLGLSVDWSYQYTTIGRIARRVSQRSFLRLLARNEAYRQEAPTLWDVDYQSAVAQAELEDREIAGAYHRIRFGLKDDATGSVEIETTRPELIPACVALVAHPDDRRYAPLFGKFARTPLFDVLVPICAHPLAEPEKGSGIAMVCTFGDLTDVTWWRELSLATRTIVGRDGRLEPVSFGEPGWESLDPERATAHYAELVGKNVKAAQRKIVELLEGSGELVGPPRPITHPVKFYERGDRPLEIVSSRQWYVRTMEHRQELLDAGRRLTWHPPFMRARYESWVEGLTGDWNISRQRFFGVPFPLWYPVRADGSIDDEHPIRPDEEALPIDPSSDIPPGYRADQRGVAGGFVGDADVMDTWATSSLTPEIAGGWEEDPSLFAQVFPMDVRPQAHEIIRTWLFSTVARSLFEHHELPWAHAAISGWILDPDRKKMSKSKGNVVVPTDLLERHGTDAVRYWAVAARLGVDTVFDEQQMKIGRRLALKILNASRFVLSRLESLDAQVAAEISDPLDLAMLGRLAQVVEDATNALTGYDHARALDRTEQFFWSFCDDYIELVKGRAYRDDTGSASAQSALTLGLSTLLRLFAPFLPFATEEAWSWWHTESIHRAAWPDTAELPSQEDGAELLELVAGVLSEVRRAKTTAKRNLRTRVVRLTVAGPEATTKLIEQARRDLCDAGVIDEITFSSAAELGVSVELAPDEPGESHN